MERPSWDSYFSLLAKHVASRSTCTRKQVGAVIVRDRNILSTGYNGSIRGLDHCSEETCLIESGHCIRTVHAEANAIVQAAKHGINIDKSTIYTTASPCWNCFKLLANAGIIRICFSEFYRDEKIIEFSKITGIELVDLKEN
ncbi:MAG: cytidine/deoxycytidylate deaminase family protein [Candidatus Heimdallarchaeota archaeon]|nr:cytidine/deoxycytidylate deaminase family protein [Candidatus Heimdallarchaeota archaeon]